MNEDRKKRGLANGKFFTAVAICALFLGSGNVMAAQTASNDSQGVQEQMQSISVTVTVVDTKGEPIIGANVIEKGTTNGGITDLDGVSKLNVKPGAILQVSFVGYTTQEVKATSVMKVVLKDDTELLDEVVVVGYGAQKKVNLTGAVASVDAVSYTHLRAHETGRNLVCRLLLEKKKRSKKKKISITNVKDKKSK